MQRLGRKLAVGLGGLALLAGGIVAGSTAMPTPANAASCYGGAVSVAKRVGFTDTQYLRTSSQCNDINVKQTSSAYSTRYVKVCYQEVGGKVGCQTSWTRITNGGGWTTVDSNVAAGKRYFLRFSNSEWWAGEVAD